MPYNGLNFDITNQTFTDLILILGLKIQDFIKYIYSLLLFLFNITHTHIYIQSHTHTRTVTHTRSLTGRLDTWRLTASLRWRSGRWCSCSDSGCWPSSRCHLLGGRRARHMNASRHKVGLKKKNQSTAEKAHPSLSHSASQEDGEALHLAFHPTTASYTKKKQVLNSPLFRLSVFIPPVFYPLSLLHMKPYQKPGHVHPPLTSTSDSWHQPSAGRRVYSMNSILRHNKSAGFKTYEEFVRKMSGIYCDVAKRCEIHEILISPTAWRRFTRTRNSGIPSFTCEAFTDLPHRGLKPAGKIKHF